MGPTGVWSAKRKAVSNRLVSRGPRTGPPRKPGGRWAADEPGGERRGPLGVVTRTQTLDLCLR